MASNDSHKVQTYVEEYTHFVLNNLVGIKGKSVGEVASFIVKSWIGEHKDEIIGAGLTVAEWKENREG